MLIGYARVSTADQTLEPQTNALIAAGCERMFTDTASGGRMDRSGLQDALSHLRAGDVLVVWKLDRLGRTTRGMLDLASYLEEKKVGLKSLTDHIDTTSAAGRMFFTLMSAFAEMERELIRERTRAGLEVARARGHKGGRPPLMTPEKIEVAKLMLKNHGITAGSVAAGLGVSRTTLYRHVGKVRPDRSPGRTSKR
jgi:DNA invertase Pin-like site-specific DNA recombinase